MTSSLCARDLAAFALQVTVIVAVGGAIWRLLDVRHPIATLAYWRALLLACLLLPFSQPWKTPAPLLFDEVALSISTPLEAGASGAQLARIASSIPRWGVAWSDVLLVCLGAGIVIRSVWLALGARRLRRMRRSARRLDSVPDAILEAQSAVGARADVYVSGDIAGPITFGFRRPVVMLPPSVLAMDTALQEAIAIHELLHVRRHDWLQVIVEETIRTVFWFHPALWWLIGRIQLTREHVVDHAVIRLTQSRTHYVEALLAVAVARTGSALVPASLFLRRRFLKRRVAQILQETTMTTRRLIASITASACALLVAAVLAVRAFPIEARSSEQTGASQPSSPSAPIQIVSGGEHLVHGALPEYPRRAIEQRIEGDVALNLTIDDRGEVSDASVISGPPELRRAALESVLQWHYSPEAMRSTSTQAVLRFQNPAAVVDTRAHVEDGHAYAMNHVAAHEPSPELESLMERHELQIRELKKALEAREKASQAGVAADDEILTLRQKLIDAEMQVARRRESHVIAQEQSSAGPRTLREVRTERLAPDAANEILQRAAIKIGDQLNEAALNRLREAAKSFDEHLRIRFDPRHGVLMMSTP